jgi:transposase
LGTPLSAAEVCGVERRVAAALAPTVAQVRAHVRTRPANVDETSWRQGRRRHWLWVAVTAVATVFLIHPTRSRRPLRELLGPRYRHVVTSDRYSTYGDVPRWRRQVCWAHLRRDFQAMKDRGGTAYAVGRDLLWVAADVFDFWPHVRDGTWRRERFQEQVAGWRKELRAALRRGRGCGCAKTAAVCRDLLRLDAALWTFAYVDGVEPTNNAAERALRHAVCWRKTSLGTDGASGSRFVEAILTVTETCRQQGREALDFVTACCAAWSHGSAPPELVPTT